MMAEQLEKAAKAGNIDEVKAGHRAFVPAAQALLNGIDAVLKNIDAASFKPAAVAPDPALLTALRDACKLLDMDGVNSIMEKIEVFRYELGGDFVALLRDRVNDIALKEIARMEIPVFHKAPSLAAEVASVAYAFTAPSAKILIRRSQ